MESEKQYAMFIHLSQLAGSIVVGLGWILPLVLWLTKKDSSEYIDANGKIVMNWIISCLIYGIVSGILCLIGIGVVLLIALAIYYHRFRQSKPGKLMALSFIYSIY